MGIISTFDPKFKKQLLEKSKEEFGAENVVYIKKSQLFLYIKVVLPFILWLSILVTLITLAVLYIPWTWLRITSCIIVV